MKEPHTSDLSRPHSLSTGTSLSPERDRDPKVVEETSAPESLAPDTAAARHTIRATARMDGAHRIPTEASARANADADWMRITPNANKIDLTLANDGTITLYPAALQQSARGRALLRAVYEFADGCP